jgi:hypothetical protein
LLSQLSYKEEANSNLQSANNRLKNEATEVLVKNNILESQARKVTLQNDEEFTRMLAVLGNNQPTSDDTLLRQVADELNECVR